MRAALKRILTAVAVLWFIGLLVLGFLAYFVTSVGPSDGLGRHLSEAPMLMRILFGQERMWAGWAWFAADMAVFWGSIAAAVAIGKLLGRDTHA